MHVEPSSQPDSSIAAMWFLPILNMGAIPLLGLHFQVSGILASGGDKRRSCVAGRFGRYCGKPRSPLGGTNDQGLRIDRGRPPCDLGKMPDVQRASLAPISILALGAELTE